MAKHTVMSDARNYVGRLSDLECTVFANLYYDENQIGGVYYFYQDGRVFLSTSFEKAFEIFGSRIVRAKWLNIL